MNLRTASLLLLSGWASAQGDPEVIARIIAEGKDNSKVWETLEYLSHEIGPRLTGSSSLQRANAWTRDEFRRLGLSGCRLEKWGEIPVRFDRGPSYARMVTPEEREFEFTARAWSAGTEGPLRGPVVALPDTREALEGMDLEGAWVLMPSISSRGPRDETEEEKAIREERLAAQDAVTSYPIAGRITGSRNDLVVTGGSWRDLTMDTLPTDVSIRVRRADYEAMEDLLAAGESLEVEADLQHFFEEGPVPVYNTVAEILGSEKPDEVVILSAHLDTWDGPGSQGTQDNGTGSSVMLEAARILMATGAKPKRTIRFCLWTGEEQGLHGSKGYVESLTEEERARVSACFVDDGGTNYQGGLVCIESMNPMLEEAIAPVKAAFPDYEIANSIQDRMPKGGASDHASFNRAGIPGFFWIEKGKGGREEKNYRFIHHTQNDTTRYAVPEYLIQSAVSSAVVAYNLAEADTLLPREEEEADAEPTVDPTFEVMAGGLTGTWKGELVGAEAPELSFVFDLAVATDGRVRGSVKSELGVATVKEGTWNSEKKTATVTCSSDIGEVSFRIAMVDSGLKGTVTGGQGSFDFVGKRLPLMDAPINGNWSLYLPRFEATASLRLAVGEDGVVRGRYKSNSSDSPLYDGKWDAAKKTATFEYDYPHAGRLPVSVTFEGGKLKGSIGESTDFVGTKVEGEDL